MKRLISAVSAAIAAVEMASKRPSAPSCAAATSERTLLSSPAGQFAALPVRVRPPHGSPLRLRAIGASACSAAMSSPANLNRRDIDPSIARCFAMLSVGSVQRAACRQTASSSSATISRSSSGCGTGSLTELSRSQWPRSADARPRNRSGVALSASTRNSGVARSGSRSARSRNSPNHVSHCSANSAFASVASNMSNAGGKPAWSGCAASTRRQNAWIVSTAAPSNSSSAASQRPRSAGSVSSAAAITSSATRTRSRSSDAAASVKVIAAMLVALTRSVASRRTMRSTSERVLPVPAPASTKSVRSRSPVIVSRASWSTRDSSIIRHPPRCQLQVR